MPIYNGSQKLKDIYIGGTKIKEIYNGSTLVYKSGYNIPMYGYDWAGSNVYLIGTNNTSGFLVDNISDAITGKSGNVGIQGSTLTIGGTTYTYNPSTYPFVSTITVNGVVLYLYYDKNTALLGVKSDIAIGRKGIIAGIFTGFSHPSSVTSTQIQWNNVLGTSTASRKSSIDTTFTGE